MCVPGGGCHSEGSIRVEHVVCHSVSPASFRVMMFLRCKLISCTIGSEAKGIGGAGTPRQASMTEIQLFSMAALLPVLVLVGVHLLLSSSAWSGRAYGPWILAIGLTTVRISSRPSASRGVLNPHNRVLWSVMLA